MNWRDERPEKDGFPVVFARDADHWRQWLMSNHESVKSVWLVIYRKGSKLSVTYEEALDEALCFGWIDSKPNKRDDQSYFQFFSKRNPKSNWSKVNKQRVERLLQSGRMAAAGLEMVAFAKETGTWNALDAVERLEVPGDLSTAFEAYADARSHWDAFPPSVRRGILEWILNAKRSTTRAKRIKKTARLAANNIRANQFRKS